MSSGAVDHGANPLFEDFDKVLGEKMTNQTNYRGHIGFLHPIFDGMKIRS